MKAFVQKSVGLGFIVSLAAACATAPAPNRVGSELLPRLTTTSTGAVLPLSFDPGTASATAKSCELSVATGNGTEYSADFAPGRNILFIELPAGTYHFKQMSCGEKHWDMSPLAWADFNVVADKVALLGGASATLLTDQNLETRLSDRARTRLDAIEALDHIPTESRSRVVSGYTGRPITVETVKSMETPPSWKLVDVEGKPVSNPQWPDFASCLDAEWKVNWLWLGHVKLDVIDEDSKFAYITEGGTPHTMSDNYVQCLKTTLKDFKPANNSRIHYVLYL